MKVLLLLAGLLAGMMIPVQTAVNVQLSKATGHPFTTTLIVFLVACACCAAVLLVSQPAPPARAQLMQLPLSAWAGGVIAAAYVVLLVTLAPQLGLAVTTTLVLAGQLLAAAILEHLGALGNPQHSLSAMRAAGLALMMFGAVLVKAY